MPVICQALVTNYGWRTAYVGLALITLVITFLFNFLFLYDKPADKGLLPDGDGVIAQDRHPPVEEGYAFKDALRHKSFWIIAARLLPARDHDHRHRGSPDPDACRCQDTALDRSLCDDRLRHRSHCGAHRRRNFTRLLLRSRMSSSAFFLDR